MRSALLRCASALYLCISAFGQAPQFEVAEIKVSNATAAAGKGRFLPSGQVDVPYTTLKELIMVAYGLQENTISGAPPWFESDHYQLTAKAPANTPMNTLRLMLRPLLAQSFKLAVHTEEKTMPVYALVTGTPSPKLRPSARPGPQSCRWVSGAAGNMRECRNLSMADLVLQLPAWSEAKIDRPVVDLTGLKGTYDFTVPGATISQALDQIGLKLEPRTHPMPVMVIDHAERLN